MRVDSGRRGKKRSKGKGIREGDEICVTKRRATWSGEEDQDVGGWMGGEWGRDWIRRGIMTHNSTIHMKIYNIYGEYIWKPITFNSN